MKKNLLISVLMTIVTTVLLGLVYPLVVTALAQLFFRDKANGQLVAAQRDSRGFAHYRPALRGRGLFSSAAFGCRQRLRRHQFRRNELGPTNQKLIDRVNADVASAQAENPGKPVPVDMVTTSASGLDPDITPASAEFQVPRVAKARGMSEQAVRAIVAQHTQGRQWGFFGEPRVNVLELNLSLDSASR